VSVGHIEYKLFNTISINDLYVEDLQHDTLLSTKEAKAQFKFWKIFRGKILITSVEFDKLNVNLVIDKAGHNNIDFIIKAFSKPQQKDSSRQVEYRIEKFELKNSTFAYTNLKMFRELPGSIINVDKLKFSNINTEVSLDLLNKDTLSAQILHLSAVERSGLTLTNLTTQILGSHTGVQLPVVNLQLPHTQLQLEDIRLKYDSLADLKKITEKVRWNIPISLSYIALTDLKAFIPDFKNLRGVVSLKGLISGRISSLRFQKMEIKYGKSFRLQADLDINGLPRLDEAFFYGQINDLRVEKNDIQDFISDLSKKPFVLPKEMNELGLIRYKGNVTGFLSNLVAYGNLNTNVGSVSTDILLKFENHLRDLTYNGTIKSENLQLGKMLNNKKLGKVSFNFNTKGTKKGSTSIQGIIIGKVPEIQFNNYSYRDITFNGKYDGKGFDGKADVKDDNINAHFTGKIDLTQKLPVYDFYLRVPNVNLYALNLTEKYPGATLSFNGKTNMIGNSLDNINGYIRFDSITFRNQNKTLNVDEIQLVSRIENNFTNFAITSDFINGDFTGNFRYSTIGATINRIVQNYLPALSNSTKQIAEKFPNNIDVNLRIANTKVISEVLALPFSLEGVTTIKGNIDEKSNRIELMGNIPLLRSNKQVLEKITIHCENSRKQLQLTTRAQAETKNGVINLFLLASAAKDSVQTQLGWQNSNKITNAGDFKAITRLRNEGGKTAAKISILPTQVIISDSIWNIHASEINVNTDSTISIRNFLFDSRKQFVHINGIASKSQNDSVKVVMNDLNLDFIMSLLRLKGISIGGSATGKVTLLSLLKQPVFQANLDVKDFNINHKWIGDAKISSNWDKLNHVLLAQGTFVNEKNEVIVRADAVYTPKADSINVIYDAHNLSIDFLTPYFESVVQNVKGFATGKVRMFGPLKDGIRFEGDAYIDKGQASMRMLKTTYYLNDTIHLTPKTIEFRNIKIYDQERNPASLNAMMTHNGLFQGMKYNVSIRGNNMLAINTTAEDNDYFFGKAYANGVVRIFGDDKEANIQVNAVSQPHTKCSIQMGGASKASDNSFINFVSKDTYPRKDKLPTKKSSDFNVKVNLQLDVNPNAEMELIVDPKGGDIITGRGSGNLRVEFDSFSDIKIYGTYNIDNGYYLFTLQNVIRKEFKIDRGSTIAWTGNPFNAEVDIRALYPLTASLKDLDATLIGENNRSTIPVNCVLKLTDNLRKPTIKFDIDLPSSDEGVKQRVRNIINTDEMMNRQIIYLLVFNKFFTPDYMRSTESNLLNNEGLSLLFSTASAQLNSLFSQFTKSNNLTVGVDYRQTDLESRDVQAQVLYQPNNRWVVNGNLGYRFDNATSSTSKLIGDVDIEYLLTESGKFRFKIYNHTIDRFQQQSTETKQGQGLGILYKEDFANVDDLLGYYWHLLTGTGKKKTNEETP